jgi:hypothetical protein
VVAIDVSDFKDVAPDDYFNWLAVTILTSNINLLAVSIAQ